MGNRQQSSNSHPCPCKTGKTLTQPGTTLTQLGTVCLCKIVNLKSCQSLQKKSKDVKPKKTLDSYQTCPQAELQGLSNPYAQVGIFSYQQLPLPC